MHTTHFLIVRCTDLKINKKIFCTLFTENNWKIYAVVLYCSFTVREQLNDKVTENHVGNMDF